MLHDIIALLCFFIQVVEELARVNVQSLCQSKQSACFWIVTNTFLYVLLCYTRSFGSSNKSNVVLFEIAEHIKYYIHNFIYL